MLATDQIALMEKSMYEVARESFKEIPVVYPKVYKVVEGATGGGDRMTQLLGADKLRQNTSENQAFQFKSPVQGWQSWVAYQTFSDAVDFSKNAVEDNVKNGQIGKTLDDYAKTWGGAIRVTKEEYAAKFFNNGGLTAGDAIFNGSWGNEVDSSGNLCYDSFPLFNLTGNKRSTKGGGTYYNGIVSGTLTPANFGTAYDLMSVSNKYTEMDTIMENKPDTLLTQDGSDYRAARRIVESTQLPGGQLNDINEYAGLVKPLSWSYLSGSAWYVGKAQHDDLQFHERQKPVIEFYRDQSTRGYRATIDVRFGVWIRPGAWKRWVKVGGSFA